MQNEREERVRDAILRLAQWSWWFEERATMILQRVYGYL